MYAKSKEKRITNKQLRLLWVLARQLGITDKLLHEIVFGASGRKSLKELSVLEAKVVIDNLVEDGAKVTKKRKPRRNLPENVIELVTGEQIRLIEYLVDQLGWDDPRQLIGFNKRVIKKERIGTTREASKIIEGLKAILNRNK